MEEQILSELANIRSYSLLAAKNVLNIEDLSLLTGLSKSQIYQMTCKREIPYYKPNGKFIYFDKAEIEAWMKKNRIQTVDEAEQKAIAYITRK